MEPLLRNIPNEYKYKSAYLDSNSNKITKLFLGSSHTYFGVNPDFIKGKSFNAGHVHQSIDLDFEILRKYKNNWNDLKCIIIPIDYSSLFVDKSNRDNFNWRKKYYNVYYDMDISNSLSENSELISHEFRGGLIKIFSYYVLRDNYTSWSKLGYGYFEGVNSRVNSDLSITGINAAKRHTCSDYSVLDSNIHVLDSIIEFATANNIDILLYTSPAYKTYVSKLDKNQLDLTINTVSKIANDNINCTYVNLLEDKHFLPNDFRDADHLNQNGAKKFSIIIDKIINNLSTNKLFAENRIN